MSRSFSGKGVMVTGASSGLGLAVARELALVEKAVVRLVARRQERLQEACADIAGRGGTADWLAADLSVPEDLDRVCRNVEEGKISVVVANAGLTYYGACVHENWAEMRQVIETNLLANMELFLRTRSVLARRGGVFCFVSSMGGRIPLAYQGVYSASKHALEAFALTCRAEQRGEGPLVKIFAPGGIDTPMYHQSGLAGKLGGKNPFNASAEETARSLVKNLRKRGAYGVPGLLNKTFMSLSRLVSPVLLARITEWVYRPPT